MMQVSRIGQALILLVWVSVGCGSRTNEAASSTQLRSGYLPDPSLIRILERDAALAQKHEEAARRCLNEGRLAEAETEATQALKIHPRMHREGDPWVLQLLAEIRIAQGRPAEAIKLLRRTATAGGLSAVDIRLELTLAHCMLGDLTSAQNCYVETSLLRCLPKDEVAALPAGNTIPGLLARTRFALAMFYQEQDQGEEALRQAVEAARLCPDNSEILFHTAQMLHRSGRKAEALAMYERVTEGKHREHAHGQMIKLLQTKMMRPKELRE